MVRAGAGGVISTDSEYFAITTEWYNHPLFQPSRPELQSNNISLVKLQQPVVYTRFVQPIRIQSSADANRNYDGQQVIATGNGNTGYSGSEYETLRWVYLLAISNNECSRLYSDGVIDTTICAQYFNVTSQATCYGDSGGPLMHVDSDGVPTLIGVSLFFSLGCDRFIRPGHFLPWFQEVTGINFDQEDTTPTSISSTTTTTITTTPTTPTAPTTTTILITTTTPTTTTTTATPTTTTTSTTTITPTTPDIIPTSTTTTIPYTQSTPTTTTTDFRKPDDPDDSTPVESTTAPPTDSEEQEHEPDGVTPEDNTVAPPEDSEDKEEDKENDSDSESNENYEIGQLMKRLQVYVKVKVRFDKYNLTNAVGNEIVAKH